MMEADFFYDSPGGRRLLGFIQRLGLFRPAAWLLHTRASAWLIGPYIKRNHIDMTPFAGQRYPSFGAFFARKKEGIPIASDPWALISPCDGQLSIYPITQELELPMKGSRYLVSDLLPEAEAAEGFREGLCLVFRLEASDYHHFCCIDHLERSQTHFIPGLLHSVQPIACRTVPVYRLNRRWWTLLRTEHFGMVAQIEVGAMLVGGVTHVPQTGKLPKGAELGNFELAGSTIVLLLEPWVRQRLELAEFCKNAVDGREVRVSMGEELGKLHGEEIGRVDEKCLAGGGLHRL